MINAGSPGSSCCSEKMITDTKNKVGISCSNRLPRRFSIAGELLRFAWRRQPSFQRQPHNAHQSVGHLLVAAQLLRVRDKNAAVIEIDLGDVLEDDFCEFFVDR